MTVGNRKQSGRYPWSPAEEGKQREIGGSRVVGQFVGQDRFSPRIRCCMTVAHAPAAPVSRRPGPGNPQVPRDSVTPWLRSGRGIRARGRICPVQGRSCFDFEVDFKHCHGTRCPRNGSDEGLLAANQRSINTAPSSPTLSTFGAHELRRPSLDSPTKEFPWAPMTT
jgi:hypothetical protein